jgi:succinate dehydrogenase/fumarate reductase flavoprotein subunit
MSEHGQHARAAAGESEAAGSGSMVNTGVSISGSTVSGGMIAGGQGARVTINQAGPADDRMAQIERLIQQLQAAASNLDGEQAEQVYADADRLLGEEKQPKPDRDRIAQLMNRISQAAVPFASLVSIAAQLKGLI